MDRRQFSLIALSAGLGLGLSACGRRGPLEPPPYTEQGREWNRRQGRNPDGTPRRAGQQQTQQGSVQEGLRRDQDERTTVDVEGEIERRGVEGEARTPGDPTQPQQAQGNNLSPTQGSRRRPPGIVPPKRDFILDPLL